MLMISTVLEAGISFLQFLESIRTPWLTVVFMLFHYVGTEIAYFVITPIACFLLHSKMTRPLTNGRKLSQ